MISRPSSAGWNTPGHAAPRLHWGVRSHRLGIGRPCAAAILAGRRGEQLQSALTTRDIIGQAKGVIMERYNIDAVRAFDMLRRLSQDMNVRLAEIAQRVVDTRGD